MALSERTRKILAVLLFSVSIFGIGGALYFTFFRAPTPPAAPAVVSSVAPSGALPSSVPGAPTAAPSPGAGAPLPTPSPVAAGGPTATTLLTQAPVADTTLNGNGASMNYYDRTDGHFYTIDANGNVQSLSDKSFPQVSSVAWNKTGSKAVLTFPDDSKIVYDFANQKQVTLPSQWQDVSFSPIGDQLEAKDMALDPQNRWLVTSNADGSNVRAIQDLGDNADSVTVSWSPNDQVVAFAKSPSLPQDSLYRQSLVPIGKNNENFQALTVEGLGFQPQWSPGGSQLLYSVSGDFSNGKPLLWITDATPNTMDQNRRSLGLNTWADKCTFASSATLYCAVPTSLPDQAGLQRVLFRTNPDQLYKVDVATGQTSLVAAPQGGVAMENLQVSKDGGTLFFTDASTQQLERIRLK